MENIQCKECSGSTAGYKCDVCNTEADVHDPAHSCGGDHCMPKCAGCGEAESKCICAGKGGKGGK